MRLPVFNFVICLFLFGLANIARAADSSIINVELRGNAPASFSALLLWEKIDKKKCKSPCQIGNKMVTFGRDAAGTAVVQLPLPSDATRACIQMGNSGLSLQSAILVMANGKKASSKRGGDLEGNGNSACTFWRADAKNAVSWILTVK